MVIRDTAVAPSQAATSEYFSQHLREPVAAVGYRHGVHLGLGGRAARPTSQRTRGVERA